MLCSPIDFGPKPGKVLTHSVHAERFRFPPLLDAPKDSQRCPVLYSVHGLVSFTIARVGKEVPGHPVSISNAVAPNSLKGKAAVHVFIRP